MARAAKTRIPQPVGSSDTKSAPIGGELDQSLEQHASFAVNAPAEFGPKQYNALVAAISLRDIVFIDSRFSAKILSRTSDASDEKTSLISENAHTAFHFDPKSRRFGSIITWKIEFRSPKQGRGAHIVCAIAVTYACSEDVDPQGAEVFIRRFNQFSTYPYVRAYVGHMAGLSGIRIPALPMLKQSPMSAKENLAEAKLAKKKRTSES